MELQKAMTKFFISGSLGLFRLLFFLLHFNGWLLSLSHPSLCLLLPVPPQPHTTSCRPLDRNGSLVYGLCLPSLPAFNFSWKVSVAWKLVYSALLLDSPSAFFVINK